VPTALIGDSLWYKDAVIYEVPVRAFALRRRRIGDFKGLTGKLDYLQDLGVTAIALPFYPSPARRRLRHRRLHRHPSCVRTLRDFKTFCGRRAGAGSR